VEELVAITVTIAEVYPLIGLQSKIWVFYGKYADTIYDKVGYGDLRIPE